jgi:hypothetical protein
MRTLRDYLYLCLPTQPYRACLSWHKSAALLRGANDQCENHAGTEKAQGPALNAIGFEADFAQSGALAMQHIERLTFPPGAGCLG